MNIKELLTGVVTGSILSIAGTFFIFQERLTTLEAKYANEGKTINTTTSTTKVKKQSNSSLDIDKRIVSSKGCDILTRGNMFFSKREYEKALNIYKEIEQIDKIGKGICVGSIYATIATIYTRFGDREIDKNNKEAAINYMNASKYNRAFAYAVDCNLKSCLNANKYWAGDPAL